jgi:hypothetical protein
MASDPTMSSLQRLFPATLVMLAGCPCGVHAAVPAQQIESNPDAVIAFNIPSQPLEQALVALGKAANIQVAYDADLLHGQRSSPVVGAFRARDALELMLRGTGLRARYTTTSGVTLAPIAKAADQVLQLQAMRVEGAPIAADQRRFTDYAKTLEARIIGGLQRSRGDTKFAYELTIRMWLLPDGRIDRMEVVSTSVSPRQTDALLAIIRSTDPLDPPPAGLPQPLPFHFFSRAGF